MQRDLLLLTEMIDAAEQAQRLATDVTTRDLEADRQRRDALLWNFTVLGEAAGQLSVEVKKRFPEVAWEQPSRLRNRIVHGYWSIDLEILRTTATDQLPAFASGLRSVLAAPRRRLLSTYRGSTGLRVNVLPSSCVFMVPGASPGDVHGSRCSD